MTTTLRARISQISRELILFTIATFAVGMATSLVDSTLNNFLNDTFSLTPFQRSFLELPRELPGLIVVFVSASLWFLGSRKLGALSLLLGGAGIFLIGFASKTYSIMVMFLFIFSLGQHLFMPVASTVGMELASEGRPGQRLGQMNAVRNLAAIVGSAVVFVGFKYLKFNYEHTFTIAAVCFIVGMVVMAMMTPSKVRNAGSRHFLKLRKEYSLFYVLAVLYGSRKQIFITFAPWVIVTVFGKPTQTIATLIVIGGVIGILFQPLLGKAIDKLGEKVVLASEAVLLVFVCLGYAFGRSVFTENTAFMIACICYLLDQVLMSVSMARSTYMKKIALQESDIQSAITAAITIDHVFSISIALVGGVIWNHFGYQYVFIFGVLIAVINFFATMRIKLPEQKPAAAVGSGID